jgi:fluoride exporter
MKLEQAIWIAGGGVIGVLLRWLAQSGWVAATGLATAWATLAINFAGSVAMAWVMTAGGALPDTARVALATGLLGGFTTFSAYSWDALSFFVRGQWGLGLLYVVGSPLAGVAGASLVYFMRMK